MPRINRQIVVYLIVGAVLVLVGLNSIRDEKTESSGFGGGVAAGSEGSGGTEQGFRPKGTGRMLVVDVAGEVRKPGVYRFPSGARVFEAIDRAGGPTSRAFLGSINRAATLSDGQQVLVPAGGPGSAEPADLAGGPGQAADAPLSLSSATQEELEEIDGIGPVTAAKIIEFRDSEGGIGSVEDLDEISGIGPVTMESLRSALGP